MADQPPPQQPQQPQGQQNIQNEPIEQPVIQPQALVLPPQPPFHTVREAMASCGFNDVNVRGGMTDAQRVAFSTFNDDFTDAINLDEKDIANEVKRYAALTQPAGKILWTATNRMRVKCFMFWVQDIDRRGLQPTLIPFLENTTTADILSQHNQLEHFIKRSDQYVSTVKVTPLKQESEWYNWKPQFTHLLKGIPGIKNVPLSYVIRTNPTPQPIPNANHLTYIEQLEATAPHTGDTFLADSNHVQILLRSYIDPKYDGVTALLRQTINSGNGRQDWLNLCIKHEGQGVNSLSLTEADRTIRTLFYDKDTSNFTFEIFTARLQKAWNAYDEANQPQTDDLKVRTLLRMTRNSSVLKNIVESIDSNISLNQVERTYDQLVMAMRNTVLNFNDSKNIRVKTTNTKYQKPASKNKVPHTKDNTQGSEAITDPRKLPKGDPKGHIRYDKDQKGRPVEINYLISYPKQIWNQLTPDQRKTIANTARERKDTSRNTSQVTTSDNQSIASLQSQVVQLTTQVQALTRTNGDDVSVLTESLVGGRTASGQHRNNHVKKVRVINSVHHDTTPSVQQSNPNTISANETDSNADTCCLGSNFAVLRYTNRSATVAPFHDGYDALTNIPIVSGVTVYDDPITNQSTLLIIHEALYFGKSLDHSLLNPNQIRHCGHTYQDNPYSSDPLHIGVDDLVIPLYTSGTKIHFHSRCPTNDEIRTLPSVELTSDYEWNPHDVNLGSVKISALSTRGTLEQLYDHMPIARKISTTLSMLDLPDAPPPLGLDRKANKFSNTRPEILAGRWGIGKKWAEATLKKTSQRYFRSAVAPLDRRYRADRHLKVKTIDCVVSTDTAFFTHKSLDQNKAAQVYGTSFLYNKVYPIPEANDKHVGQTLKDFIHEIGKPLKLLMDGAQVQIGTHTTFKKVIRQYNIDYHISEPYRHNENPVEGNIRELKKRWYRIMVKRGVPKRLWDYGLIWVAETGNFTVNGAPSSNGLPPESLITGEVPEISAYLEFDFYDWVEFRENAGLGPSSIGRWLGVSHSFGKLMSFWVLGISGAVMPRGTVARLLNLKRQDPIVKNQMDEFDAAIRERLNDPNHIIPNNFTVENGRRVWNLLDIEDDPIFAEEFYNVIDNEQVKHIDEQATDDVYDPYVNVEIGLPHGPEGERLRGHVRKRAIDDHNNPIGVAHDNPILDTRAYVVEFIDGDQQIITANIIAENILSQVDEDGHTLMLIDEILDHRTTDELLSGDDAFYTDRGGNKRIRRSTKGWEICVVWKDGSTNWVAMKDLKDSYPVPLAEYAIAAGIDNEPAFQWWVSYVVKKKDRIISKIKSKYWDRTHKFGIRIPKSIDEAMKLDLENNNTYWRDAIKKEMTNAIVAFQPYYDDISKLVGYQRIDCHWIFDIKVGENFRRKARIVAGGHRTKTPSSVTYSTVVSRDSIRICLTIAALHGMKVMTADIQNAYLTAPCREKIWCKAGPEFEPFGIPKGTPMLLVRALYGLKSSGAAFRAFCAEQLDKMNFHSSTGDPDVWMRPTISDSGEEFYEYMLVYVDDIMSISFDPQASIMQFTEHGFTLKGGQASVPENYVGTELAFKHLANHEVDCWTLNTTKYIKHSLDNLEERLTHINRTLPTTKQCQTPIVQGYKPELDASQELDHNGITMFQELIGILRWATEMGRVDILYELSVLSSYQAAPRQGHLDQVLHIFGYLKHMPKLTLYLDPTRMPVNANIFRNNAHEFKEQYRDAKELIPHDMPKPRGHSVRITAYVDSDHASNQSTRRSHTGYIIFINRSPILWYSKKQNTVETSTFGSEFLAMKTVTEAIIALRAKLYWFGISIDGPADVYADNESMVNCTRDFDTKLNKKHNAISYHYCRQAVAAEVIRTGKVHTDHNIADPYTKALTAPKRNTLFQSWTY